jgi:site-specific recombinase XerD
MTITETLPLYLQALKRKGRTSSTIDEYERKLKQFLAFIEETYKKIPLVQDVTPNMIQSFLNSKKELSPTTRAQLTTILYQLFEFMIYNQMITTHPMAEIKRPKVKGYNLSPLTEKEEKTIVDKATKIANTKNDFLSLRNLVVIHLFLYCGLGAGEVLDLTPENIQDEHIWINNRRVPLRVETRGLLKIYQDMTNGFSYLIVDKKGEPLAIGTLEHITRKIGKQIGLENITPGRLRRTYAANLIKEGKTLLEFQRLLGLRQFSAEKLFLELKKEGS